MWEEGDSGDNFLNVEESGYYSDFAFILIKCFSTNILVVLYI